MYTSKLHINHTNTSQTHTAHIYHIDTHTPLIHTLHYTYICIHHTRLYIHTHTPHYIHTHMHMQTEPFINTLQSIFQCFLITCFLLLSYISFSSYSIFLYFYFLNQKGPLKTKIISSMLVSIIWRSVCVPSLDMVSQKDNREEPVPRVIDTPPKREEVSAHKGKKRKKKQREK